MLMVRVLLTVLLLVSLLDAYVINRPRSQKFLEEANVVNGKYKKKGAQDHKTHHYHKHGRRHGRKRSSRRSKRSEDPATLPDVDGAGSPDVNGAESPDVNGAESLDVNGAESPDVNAADEVHARGEIPDKSDKTGDWLLNPDGSRPLLFIGINSAPGRWEARDDIRQTWMQHYFLLGENPLVHAKFIVGQPEPGSAEAMILDYDMAQHGDFIQLETPEGYHNLVNKTIAYFHWFANRGKALYVMKIDDDTFPNVGMLVPRLQAKLQNGKRFTYAGDLRVHSKMLLWGRWKQDPNVYNQTYYPIYAAGPAYLMGADLARVVFLEHFEMHKQQTLDNEDTNVGLWIHSENISRTCVDYQVIESEEEGCLPGMIFNMNLKPGKMRCMWDRWEQNESDICCDHHLSDWEMRNAIIAERLQAKAVLDERRKEMLRDAMNSGLIAVHSYCGLGAGEDDDSFDEGISSAPRISR